MGRLVVISHDTHIAWLTAGENINKNISKIKIINSPLGLEWFTICENVYIDRLIRLCVMWKEILSNIKKFLFKFCKQSFW